MLSSTCADLGGGTAGPCPPPPFWRLPKIKNKKDRKKGKEGRERKEEKNEKRKKMESYACTKRTFRVNVPL